MPAIVLPETSHSEILGGARIKWTDPLNNGLMFAFAPGASGSITRELARGAMGTAAGTPAFRGDAFGGAKSYSENNTSWVAFPDSAEYDSDDITIFAVVTPRASSGDQSQVVARNYDGSKVPFNLQLQNSIAVLQGFGFFNGTAWKNIAFTAAPVANERVAVAGRNAGGTLAVFKNGRLDASSTGNGACPAGTAGIAVGSYVNDSFGFNGGIHCVYVWRRALSDREIADLTLKPFKIFETRPRILYFPSAGGGATITGSGTPTAQSSTVAGTAERSVTGTGTPTAQASAVAGVAERVITSSGTPTAQSSTVSGTGTVGGAFTGSGTLQAQSATVSGTAERSVTGTGAPASQAATVSGTAERVVTGTGTPTSQSSTVSGTGQVGNVVTGSGSPTAQAATVSGTAERTVTSSGALSAQSSTVAGTAERTITGSGALSAQSSTVYGFDSTPVDTGVRRIYPLAGRG